METKSDRFQRLAEARVTKAISMLRSISKLSNRSHYEYSPEDVQQIFQAIKRETESAKAAFDIGLKRDGDSGFHLGGKENGK